MNRAARAAIVVLAAALLCIGVADPWVSRADYNGAVLATAARNHVERGYGATRLGVTLNNSPAADRLVPYVTHPPLAGLLVAVPFRLFGPAEWAARLVPILFSLGSLLLVMHLGTRIGGRATGLLAGVFWAILPMTAYYGQMVNHEAPTAFLILASVAAYAEWAERRRGIWLALSVGCYVIGMAAGWPAYFLGVLLPAWHVLSERRRSAWVLAYPALALGMFGVHLLHVLWLSGATGLDELFQGFRKRANPSGPEGSEAWMGTGLAGMAVWARTQAALFTAPALVLAAIGALRLWREPARFRHRLIPAALMALALMHVLLFIQGTLVHPYWTFYAAAPVVLLAAVALTGLSGRRTWLVPAATLLVVAFAVPELRRLHAEEDRTIPVLAAALRARTSPSEALLADAVGIATPQVLHYARRDMQGPAGPGVWEGYGALRDTAGVIAAIASHPGASHAFVARLGEAPGLDRWLAQRYPFEAFDVVGRAYRVYHIPAAR